MMRTAILISGFYIADVIARAAAIELFESSNGAITFIFLAMVFIGWDTLESAIRKS